MHIRLAATGHRKGNHPHYTVVTKIESETNSKKTAMFHKQSATLNNCSEICLQMSAYMEEHQMHITHIDKYALAVSLICILFLREKCWGAVH